MSCALMPVFDRNTARRGRSAVPETLPRTRRCRRSRSWRVVAVLIAPPPARPTPPRSCLRRAYGKYSRALTNLPADVLALVTDALALVWLGRPHLADLGRDLADLLLVDALDDDLGRGRNVVGDPRGRVLDDRVREADV